MEFQVNDKVIFIPDIRDEYVIVDTILFPYYSRVLLKNIPLRIEDRVTYVVRDIEPEYYQDPHFSSSSRKYQIEIAKEYQPDPVSYIVRKSLLMKVE